MTQNTEQKARTNQIEVLTGHFVTAGYPSFPARKLAEDMVSEAEARGAAEQRRKDAEMVSAIDPAIISAALEFTDTQKKLPEWVHLNPETGDRSLGRWARGITGEHAPYIRADLAAHPANVAALEARVKELEAENAALRARNIGQAPETVPYSDPVKTMSTEQLCQRLRVLRVRWDELMDSDEEMGGGSPMESMDEEMQSLENEISRRAALKREGGE